MNKYEMIKDAIKNSKNGINGLKEKLSEYIKELKEEIKKSIRKKIIIPNLPWIINAVLIVVLISAVIGAVAYAIAAIGDFFEQVWHDISYVFIGTKADIKAEDIENVRNEIAAMNIDFSEIGYVGFIKIYNDYLNSASLLTSFLEVENVYQYKIAKEIANIPLIGTGKAYVTTKLNELQTQIDKAAQEEKEQSDKIRNGEINNTEQDTTERDKLADQKYEYIDYYITKYLEAQAETLSLENTFTFSEDDGSVRIRETNTFKSLKNSNLWIGNHSLKIILDDDNNFWLKTGEENAEAILKPINITDEMVQIYMPWQYPLVFHTHTLSPDVGYLVAELSRYHQLEMIADSEDIVFFEVEENEDEEGNITYSLISENPKIASYDDLWDYQIMDSRGVLTPLSKLVTTYTNMTKVGTWYETVEYSYEYQPKNPNIITNTLEYEWTEGFLSDCGFTKSSRRNLKYKGYSIDSKTGNIYCEGEKLNLQTTRNANGDIVKYMTIGRKNEIVQAGTTIYDSAPAITRGLQAIAGEDILEEFTGKAEMRQILLPAPELKAENGKVVFVNESEVPEYYIANTKNKEKNTKEFTGEMQKLNVSTVADGIVYDINMIYSDYNTGKNNENKTLKGDDIGKETFESIIKDSKSSMKGDYLRMNVRMVSDIVYFFLDNGIIDAKDYFGDGESSMYNDLGIAYFFEETEGTAIIGYGNPNTIKIASGTNVLSPITGTVTLVEDDKIEITKYGTYEQADKEGITYDEAVTPDGKVPLMKIVLTSVENISVLKGAKVTAGVTKIGNVGNSEKIVFTHILGDNTLQSSNKVEEELKMALQIKNLKWIMPLPAGQYTVGAGIDPNGASWAQGGRQRPEGYTGNAPSYYSQHSGQDFPCVTGTSVYASASGTVIESTDLTGSYGRYVKIDHGDGYISIYGHMDKRLVYKGQKVTKGDLIGMSDSTGNSTGPHLHFEIRHNGKLVDPLSILTVY